MKRASLALALAVAVTIGAAGWAVAQGPPAYGPAITLEQAMKVMVGAETEAKKNNWPVAIVVLDSGGNLVALHRLDNTQFGSIEIARQKAWSAVAFRRPTKAFQDGLAAGGVGLRILALEGASPVEGGLPILVDGKVVGSVGVSGVTGEQDSMVAAAGVAALK
jgi:glc operon protein GlcG